MKKVVSILFILTMVFTTYSIAYASSNATNLDKRVPQSKMNSMEIQENLLEKGVSLEEQLKMPEAMKMDVANDNTIIKLVSVSDDSQPQPIGIESVPSGLSVRTYIYTTSDVYGYPAFKLYTSWNWTDNNPLAYLTDKVGIAWNLDCLTVYSNYMYFCSQDGYGNNYTVSKNVADDGSDSFWGRGFSVPLSGIFTFNKSGYMYVKVYDTTKHGTMELKTITRYFHKNILFDGSLSFSGAPSISITPSYNYDTPVTDYASYFYSTN